MEEQKSITVRLRRLRYSERNLTVLPARRELVTTPQAWLAPHATAGTLGKHSRLSAEVCRGVPGRRREGGLGLGPAPCYPGFSTGAILRSGWISSSLGKTVPCHHATPSVASGCSGRGATRPTGRDGRLAGNRCPLESRFLVPAGPPCPPRPLRASSDALRIGRHAPHRTRTRFPSLTTADDGWGLLTSLDSLALTRLLNQRSLQLPHADNKELFSGNG